MAISLTGLTNYVEEQRLPLISKTMFHAPSVKHFNLQTGIKHAAALNILSTTVEFGDGSTCGWNEAGVSEFSQRVLEVGNFKVNMAFCDKDMLSKWMGYEVRVAAGQKELPFEEEFVNGIIDGVSNKIERALWQGVKATDRIDGILTILAAETGASAPITVSLATGDTIYDKTIKTYKAIPSRLLDKAAIFMGVDSFRDLVLEMTEKNLYHHNPAIDESLEVVLPGTSTRIYGVSGLNNSDAIVAANPENIYYGVDMEGDEEKFDLWYSKDNQQFRLAINFNAGVQVAFPEDIAVASWS